jgi:two-component system response regulator
VLVADDDADDRLLTRDALVSRSSTTEVRFVADGVELLEYLRRRGRFADLVDSPRPGLILLDLNMPRMSGHEVLRELKADPALREIPVVVLSTSSDEEDVRRAYEIGGSSYIRKPVAFDELVEAMHVVTRYWLGLVEHPPSAWDAT